MQMQFHRHQKIYLDTCCLGRPYDDQMQDRVRAETEAVEEILDYFSTGQLHWIISEVLVNEVDENPHLTERDEISATFNLAQQMVLIGETETARATQLEVLGFKWFDALHIACAESADAAVLLTTDDSMLKRAKRLSEHLHVRVENPYTWLQEGDSGGTMTPDGEGQV